jgi:hypothetical protein
MNANEPAFPGFSYTHGHGPSRRNAEGEWENFVPGLTKREEFAKAMMAAMLSTDSRLQEFKEVATFAVHAADCLLAELEKKP